MEKQEEKKEEKKEEVKSGKKDFKEQGKTGSKNKKKQGFKKQQPPGRKDGENGERKPKNDPSWYMVTEQIGKAGASLPYNVMTGAKVEYPMGFPSVDKAVSNLVRSLPGIMALSYRLTCGSSTSGSSAVNVAARAVYSYVRHANSGSANYEAPDLMMYLLANAQIYAALCEARKAYQCAMTYSNVNRYLPDMMLTSFGYDSDFLRKNLAQFRYRVNMLIAKLSSLAVPKAFSYFERVAFLPSVVLSDHSSVKGQFYVYSLDYLYKWSPRTSTQGSELHCLSNWKANKTPFEILDTIDECIEAMLIDEDINIMSGDIMKAYKDSEFYVMKEVDEAETMSIVYSEDLLQQIENCWITPAFEDNSDVGSSPNIQQKNGYIHFNPVSLYSLAFGAQLGTQFCALGGTRPFNSYKESPEWKDNLEWARFLPAVTEYFDVEENSYRVRYSFGIENIHKITIYAYDYDTSGNRYLEKFSEDTNAWVPSVSFAQQQRFIARLTQFDWHPIFMFNDAGSPQQNTSNVVGYLADFKVTTTIDRDTAVRLNELSVLGLFKTKTMV